jgi:predicted nucleic-acid-binding protein
VVWVLAQGYKIRHDEISKTLRRLIDSDNVVVDRPAVEAGLAMLDAGGDFADGIIAFEGRTMGAQAFMSFDKQAVKLLKEQGIEACLLT